MRITVIETGKDLSRPTSGQLRNELEYERFKSRNTKKLISVAGILAVVVAVSIICTTFFFTVMRIQGHSMEPLLYENELILVLKTNEFDRGDLVAFYYNNKILIKRVIGFSGDWVNIDATGDVYVNGEKQNEPYVLDKCLGNGDVDFPYQVADSHLFVLGDHRSTSSDSRDSMIGTVAEEQIVGKVALRFWPLSKFSLFN
jgi:signal peptidase I